MANMPIAAAIFRRGDVRAAKQAIRASLPPDAEPRLIAESGSPWSLAYAGQLGLSRQNALVHRVETQIGKPAAQSGDSQPRNVPPADRYESDTGELVWDRTPKGREALLINSPRTKAVIGLCRPPLVPLG